MVAPIILLASYNGAAYLPALLRSLSDQTYPDFTVLFQDDGSDDESPEILRRWSAQDARFRPGREQGAHLGPVGNFFSMLRQASGDAIFFCDQDDLWEKDKLQIMLDRLTSLSATLPAGTPLLLHSDASLIGPEDQPLGDSLFRLQGWDPEAVTFSRLLVQNNVTGCLMMINRPLADLALRYGDPSRMFMHDWFLALSAAAFGQILFLNRPLVRYRQHAGNTVGASRASLLKRGLKALREREKAQERIQLTYRHTEDFLRQYGEALPAAAKETADAYLATRTMGKLSRIRQIRRLNCLMQSPVTRLGQMLFG